jgi:DNA-damage-inducible protein D
MAEKKDLLSESKSAVFKGREIRKTIHNNEWWFVIEDVVVALTDSMQPKGYIKDMRRRDPELAKGWGQIATPLSIQTAGGLQQLNCANTEGIFRIIQSIPSPKAEPFKRWLAKIGYERVQEIEDPELAIKRMRTTYRIKGYSEEWIEKRVRGIDIRKKLTDEWKKRGVKGEDEYSILTSEISKAAFGMTPEEYKRHKGLEKPSENLRDHMTDLELIFSMLGEAATTEITQKKDVVGFGPAKKAAGEGGAVAGNARKELEKRSGRKIVSAVNYKKLPEKQVRKLLES